MALINKRLLEKTLNKYRHDISKDQKNELKTLFKETLERIDKKKFKPGRGLPSNQVRLAPFGKEGSEKVPFLQKMFELLGYKLHENLEFEFSIQGRIIDGVLGETPVSQIWDYMGKVGAEIGIVGNFIEWRLYTLKVWRLLNLVCG